MKTHRMHPVLPHKSSNVHEEVSSTLDELGVGHRCEIPIVNGCLVGDAVIQDVRFGGKVVVVVDGPHHYSRNKHAGEQEPLGETLYRNAILEKNGWQVRIHTFPSLFVVLVLSYVLFLLVPNVLR